MHEPLLKRWHRAVSAALVLAGRDLHVVCDHNATSVWAADQRKND